MPHKGRDVIEKELRTARTQVRVGGTYSHYKNPEHLVKVVAIGIQEATDKLCVVYQDAADRDMLFVRDLDSWLEEPLKDTPRFRLVNQ
jgi:hypothetical protein